MLFHFVIQKRGINILLINISVSAQKQQLSLVLCGYNKFPQYC